jgi:uncharacterized membrane protein
MFQIVLYLHFLQVFNASAQKTEHFHAFASYFLLIFTILCLIATETLKRYNRRRRFLQNKKVLSKKQAKRLFYKHPSKVVTGRQHSLFQAKQS